jgi:hypothetical protein
MKKIHFDFKTSLSLFLFSSFVSNACFAQENMSRENTIIAGTDKDIGDGIIVYEAPVQIGFDENDLHKKKYYYIPTAYEIEKLNSKPNIKITHDSLSIRVNVLPIWPDKNTLITRLDRSGENNFINANYLAKLNFYDILVRTTNTTPNKFISFETQLPNATNISESFSYQIVFSKKRECVSTYTDILDGSLKLSISLGIRFWHGTGYSINLSRKDFMNSDAYRDFISPVEGKTIWLFKLQTCRTEIESQIKTKIVREGENPILEGDLQNFWQEYLEYKPHFITFDEMCQKSNANEQLEKFHELTRYQSDEIRKIAQDAESLSDHDFYKKYHSELKKQINDDQTHQRNADGKFGFKQILNIGGNYGSQSSRKYSNELNKIVDDEKKLRKYLKESFHYEQEGNVYVPKGIIATEIINSKGKIEYINKQISINYKQGFEYKTYPIKL